MSDVRGMLASDPRYGEALAQLQVGKWPEAIENLQALQQEYPDSADLAESLQQAEIQASYTEEWRKQVKGRRLPFEPKKVLPRVGLVVLVAAMAYIGLTAYREWYLPSRERAAVHAEGLELVQLGHEALARGDFAAAQVAFDQALVLSPDDAAALEGLAEAERQAQLDADYQAAVVLAADEDREPAIQAFLDLQARAPGYRDVSRWLTVLQTTDESAPLFALAEEHFQKHEWQKAIEAYEALRAENSDYEQESVAQHLFDSYLAYGLEFVNQPRDDDTVLPAALEAFGQALSLRPGDAEAEAEQELASAYSNALDMQKSGQWVESALLLRTVYDRNPDYFAGAVLNDLYQNYLSMGNAAVGVGDVDLAMSAYSMARRLDVPDHSGLHAAYLTLGADLVEERKLEEAYRAFALARKIAEVDQEPLYQAYIAMGDAEFEEHRMEEALTAYAAAGMVERASHDPLQQAYVHIGDTLVVEELIGEALQIYGLAGELVTEDQELLFGSYVALGDSLVAGGDLEGALGVYELASVCRVASLEPLYRSYLALGDVHQSLGERKLALKAYELAGRLEVDDVNEAMLRISGLAPGLTPTATPTPTSTPTPTPTNTPTPSPPTATPLPSPLWYYSGWIAFQSNRDGALDIYVMRSDGSQVQRMHGSDWGVYEALIEAQTLSPDGTTRVYAEAGGGEVTDLFIFREDLPENWLRRWVLVDHGKFCYDPRWSPHGDRIVFVSQKTGNDEIWTIYPDGSDEKQLTKNDWEWDKFPTYSQDGTQIAFWSNRETGHPQIWVMNADGTGQKNISNNEFDEKEPVWIRPDLLARVQEAQWQAEANRAAWKASAPIIVPVPAPDSSGTGEDGSEADGSQGTAGSDPPTSTPTATPTPTSQPDEPTATPVPPTPTPRVTVQVPTPTPITSPVPGG